MSLTFWLVWFEFKWPKWLKLPTRNGSVSAERDRALIELRKTQQRTRSLQQSARRLADLPTEEFLDRVTSAFGRKT